MTTAQYRFSNNTVQMRGQIYWDQEDENSDYIGIFQLPLEYRPKYVVMSIVPRALGEGYCRFSIKPDGIVSVRPKYNLHLNICYPI